MVEKKDTGKTPSLLVVGSLNMDLVMNCDRLPEPGESRMGQKYDYIPGGKGANQAVAASRLGAEVTFAGKRGSDANGEILEKSLIESGIDTDFLKIDNNSKTGLASIFVDEEGENRILVFPGANMEINWKDIEAVFNNSFDIILLQLEIPRALNIKVWEKARQEQIPVIMDMGPAQSFPLQQVEGIKILSPNETEAQALTGIKVNSIKEAEKAAAELARISRAEMVVIKLGAKGSLLYQDNHSLFFPAYEVDPVDTTAAGDAFTAALGHYYIKSGEIETAVKYANAAGACTVTGAGAQTSLPDTAAVEKMMRENKLKE